MFLEGFESLRNLKIFVSVRAPHDVEKVVKMLENSVYVKRLRARRNLLVDIRGKDSVFIIHHTVVSECFFRQLQATVSRPDLQWQTSVGRATTGDDGNSTISKPDNKLLCNT